MMISPASRMSCALLHTWENLPDWPPPQNSGQCVSKTPELLNVEVEPGSQSGTPTRHILHRSQQSMCSCLAPVLFVPCNLFA